LVRRTGRSATVLLLCAAALHALPAAASSSSLDDLMAEYWDYYLAEYPVAATRNGVDRFNNRFASVTPAAETRRLAIERRFLARLEDIDDSAFTEGDRINAQLFEWILRDAVGARQLDLGRIPFNTFSGFFMNAITAATGVRMENVGDYEDYLERLQDIPRYFDENIANLESGSRAGFVLPRVVIDGVVPTLRAQVKESAEDSGFYEPLAEQPEALSRAEHLRLSARAREIISDQVFPAFAELADFLERDYQASDTIGASFLPRGAEYYAFQIRRYTTLTDIDADEIHRAGLDEVARIRAEMLAIIDEVGFDGSFDDFTEFLRTDPQFYAKTPIDLLKEAAWIAKRVDYQMPRFFGKLPRQSYGVVPVPDEIAPNYTTGAYFGAPLNGANGGAFWLNTYALDQRPLYELPALTLHEAVPGHHHQGALALEMMEVPAFRRDLYFSAFGEGWALYAEKLGVEMGIYQTPYEHFGRLSYEMWRACRLVVDTGIHAKGWTRQQAIDYMTANTGLSEGNIRAEVDRYISWPGQALAYKLGEIKIWELRREAEATLGEAFDLREFHDVLLGNGALPLAALERVVQRYIDSKLP